MSISIALAGKPNSGKSTFFKAATLANVEIANYPFTTIDANHGVAYVRTVCPCRELKLDCGNCREGARFVPVEMIDVAGLVPDAHKGRGLGNEFLDNLRQAKAIIHVIDASGGTDIEGNPVTVGSHDPLGDIEFLPHEITMWMAGILKRNWERLSRKVNAEGLKIEETIASQLEGAGITEAHVRTILSRMRLPRDKPQVWTEEQIIELSDMLRAESKPFIIAANKIDIASQENIERLLKKGAIPVSGATEVVLRLADKSGAIKYIPGDADFVESPNLTSAQKEALSKIRLLLKKNGGTGIQKCINETVFKLLELIVVYPVEDENRFTDKKGTILPDAFIMKKGSTPKDLAFMIHTDIGKSFLHAVDARTKMRLGEKHELKNGDIVKIVSVK
ncbi:MAG: translation-associated GTPase [Candidatus Methanoperedens nitroreducens]|uniref:Translation-associated GTPase n=1 Tax=Candidatus Methanoperedens nitratireducens TaxID=1392998 RepID=A0A0P8A6J6_9EURY|nr:redox-regulated ATPase YchF [Candidatus Methanoperedens sp. BLZ2]KAB2948339.1 MAG: redox-regulated ATPase YchF [Candidatus Methanoperedens sp.]KPQ43744.1 MAG: translation-associated GTPase [Candidatus Methanoperedens sp. BLZ1]MBZ0174578.1 redox-regulated ATPase YchF [Candidatus Methanoperedens nitroreducens]MCX9078603.1 redox-regulated ATPase YchF [Candidatus Methanoperedens sp.]MCX9086574.1 redox-regulated ATPase YchF [Candidatus Methanoperedens sp.]